jgi:hypothetical protein
VHEHGESSAVGRSSCRERRRLRWSSRDLSIHG